MCYAFIHLHLSEVCWVQLQVQASALVFAHTHTHPSQGPAGAPVCQTLKDKFVLSEIQQNTHTANTIKGGCISGAPAMATIQISSERNHSLAALIG